MVVVCCHVLLRSGLNHGTLPKIDHELAAVDPLSFGILIHPQIWRVAASEGISCGCISTVPR